MSSLFFRYDLPAKLVSFGVRKTVGVNRWCQEHERVSENHTFATSNIRKPEQCRTLTHWCRLVSQQNEQRDLRVRLKQKEPQTL